MGHEAKKVDEANQQNIPNTVPFQVENSIDLKHTLRLLVVKQIFTLINLVCKKEMKICVSMSMQ